MLSFQEDEGRRLWLHVGFLRLDHQELYVFTVTSRERLGDETRDVLVLETLDAGAVHLQDQLAHFQAARAVRSTVLLQHHFISSSLNWQFHFDPKMKDGSAEIM